MTNNADNFYTHLGKIESHRSAYVAPSLNYSAFLFYVSSPQLVIGSYGLSHTETGTHVFDGISFFQGGRVTFILYHLAHALAQLVDAMDFLLFVRFIMT